MSLGISRRKAGLYRRYRTPLPSLELHTLNRLQQREITMPLDISAIKDFNAHVYFEPG